MGLNRPGKGEVENSNLSGGTRFFDASGGPYISEVVLPVTDVGQIQPVSRGYRPARAPRSRPQCLADLVRSPCARSDALERSGNAPYLAVQEALRGCDKDIFRLMIGLLNVYIECVDGADWRSRLAGRRAKRREVMVSEQLGSAPLHGSQVEFVAYVPGAVSPNRERGPS